MAAQCPLCDRSKEPVSEYCHLHQTAYSNLKDAYPAWNKAFGGNLTMQEYYSKLEALAETGPAAKEIISRLHPKEK